jgi:hypothetical protein
MGRGLKAYEGIDVVPAEVDAQEQFFRDWLGSLGR